MERTIEVKEVKHTPTPWKNEEGCVFDETNEILIAETDRDSMHISIAEAEANAAIIARAVNSHEALMNVAEQVAELLPCVKDDGGSDGCLHCDAIKAMEQAEGA